MATRRSVGTFHISPLGCLHFELTPERLLARLPATKATQFASLIAPPRLQPRPRAPTRSTRASLGVSPAETKRSEIWRESQSQSQSESHTESQLLAVASASVWLLSLPSGENRICLAHSGEPRESDLLGPTRMDSRENLKSGCKTGTRAAIHLT